MKLIDQKTKNIMEGCKERARDAGLSFDNETLEYIVTNKEMIKLLPKIMIPTLYDYWTHDVGVLKGQGIYKLHPNNPFESVINTRPAVSFYNDNNPEWLNTMIFYHVLGHIDFFQNNMFFKNTWNGDFMAQAYSDKKHIEKLRRTKGRFVDYVIEFTRSIDNLVGYHNELSGTNLNKRDKLSRVDFYFNDFLQSQTISEKKYNEYLDRSNALIEEHGESIAEKIFFEEVKYEYPKFEKKYTKNKKPKIKKDLIQYIQKNSDFLKKEKNKWMHDVINIVRNTSLYFQPQVRTKIANEGWASYWHTKLFLEDERIQGNETAFAKMNAKVLSFNNMGLNPYALGIKLIEHAEDIGNKGKLGFEFNNIKSIDERLKYDKKTGEGKKTIFNLRENYCDFTLVNQFIDQDFVDRHKLYVMGKRKNTDNPFDPKIEYYIKSRNAEDYKKMVIDSLHNPPSIEFDIDKSDGNKYLYLNHKFEGKKLQDDYIRNTMTGIEFLWGGPVKLETTDVYMEKYGDFEPYEETQRVLYTIKDKKLEEEDI